MVDGGIVRDGMECWEVDLVFGATMIHVCGVHGEIYRSSPDRVLRILAKARSWYPAPCCWLFVLVN